MTLVDPSDIPLLRAAAWSTHINHAGGVYAIRRSKGRTIILHREIAGQDGLEVDHIDHDGLNNRRRNLRPATKRQNAANREKRSGKYKGVQFKSPKLSKPWLARFCREYIGYFETEEGAARAYDARALAISGDYALLNFPAEHRP